MFCPKCGAANPENSAFCRDCGEDLKIVSQAMKKNSAVALISRLDAVIEQKNERFRRNAIFMGLAGGVFSAGAILQWIFLIAAPMMKVTFPLMAVVCLAYSAWFALVYVRSLEFPLVSNDKPRKGSRLFTQVKEEQGAGEVFCSSCGTVNDPRAQYCRSCGEPLIVRDVGLARYLPGVLTNRLDAAVVSEKDLAGAYRMGWLLVLLAFIYVFNLVLNLMDGRLDSALLYGVLFLSTIVISGWDYLTYRRSQNRTTAPEAEEPRRDLENQKKEPPSLIPPDPTAEFLENPTVPIGEPRSNIREAEEPIHVKRRTRDADEFSTGKLAETEPLAKHLENSDTSSD